MIRKSCIGICGVMLLALAGAMVSTGCSDQVAMPTVEELGADAGRARLEMPIQPPDITQQKAAKKR